MVVRNLFILYVHLHNKANSRNSRACWWASLRVYTQRAPPASPPAFGTTTTVVRRATRGQRVLEDFCTIVQYQTRPRP